MRPLVLVWLCCAVAWTQEIAGPRIRAHLKFLSSDLLEGRGVGVRGGDLAAEYLASQLERFGAKPAGERGTYYQTVPLVGVDPQPSAELSGSAQGKTLAFRWVEDFVGMTQQQKESAMLDAPAVFVGHGIAAPEYNW